MKPKKEQGFIEKIVRAVVKKYLPGFYLAHRPQKFTVWKPAKDTEAIS